uniref:Protein PIN-LIKES 7 n=1 Tax=Zea mays TaxID=4577 RepID=A0A804UDJ8_MAIZE
MAAAAPAQGKLLPKSRRQDFLSWIPQALLPSSRIRARIPQPPHVLTPPPTFLHSRRCHCQEALTIACRREGDRRIPVNASSVDFVFAGRALDAAKLLADLAPRPRGSSSPMSTASSAAMHGHGGILGETDSSELQEVPLLSCESEVADKGFWTKLKDAIHQFIEEVMAPPTISAIIGFVVGLVPWLKSLIVGDEAPFKVIQDSLQLMGDDTIPCITLILGGNLTQGGRYFDQNQTQWRSKHVHPLDGTTARSETDLNSEVAMDVCVHGFRKSGLKRAVIVVILCVRFVLLPLIGIAVVRVAYGLGFLSRDLLYRYVLMVQFAMPPAMNIRTMAQLFDVGQEECSVIFRWTYLVAAVALTAWSTVFMSVLS